MGTGLQPHQQRVVDEQADLDTKLAALTLFMTTTTFAGLDEAERTRLYMQGMVMGVYSSILGLRIIAFTPS